MLSAGCSSLSGSGHVSRYSLRSRCCSVQFSLALAVCFPPDQSFELSVLTLFLLVLVLVSGSGQWSLANLSSARRLAVQKKLDGFFIHRQHAFDLMRMFLGVALFIRGTVFIADSSRFMTLLGADSASFLQSAFLVHYVALAHVFGGFMLAAGLLSRLAALVQLPVLGGAVTVSLGQGGFVAGSQNLEIACLTLFLLILVLLYGSGTWSADHYLLGHPAGATVVDRTPKASEILSEDGPSATAVMDPVKLLAIPESKTDAEIAAALRDNPLVVTSAKYPFWGWLLFMVDVTPRPKEIVFRHIKTGKIIKRSKDPEILRQFRYR